MPYPRPGYAWTVVAILIGTAVLAYTDRQVLSLLVDPIRADLHISDLWVSLLLGTAFAIVYGIAALPFGYLADKISRRNLILAGVLVWSCGTIACGLSHSFGQLFASRLVVGLAEAVLSPAAISLISDYFPPSRRGTAVGCYLSGIAFGIGVSILIGGGVLSLVEVGAFANTPLAPVPPWRLVLLVIGAPGFVWALAILAIREPVRRGAEGSPAGDRARDGAGSSASAAGPPSAAARASSVASAAAQASSTASEPSVLSSRAIPIYLVVAIASLVDNAVGAWAPTLLTRNFHMDPAQVGVRLGTLLTAAFGGGVLLGGWLADRVGARGGWPRKLQVCLVAGALILPVAGAMNSSHLNLVLLSVPAYFALSGIVTACGFSAILDVVPNQSRGLAMGVSFFLNVAVGGAVGPTAVALASDYVFGAGAGLGPALSVVVAIAYALAFVSALAALSASRASRAKQVV
jgi:MFS family permease